MRKLILFACLLVPHAALAALPGRFLPVAEGIFRSAQPAADNFDSLKNEAGIRTIVSISNDRSDIEEEARNAAAAGIRFISIPLSGFYAPSDENVNAILKEVSDRGNWPVLFHCLHGRDRTGLIAGLYRVELEKWTPKKAFREMLALGFRRALVPLEYYYRQRTGYRDLMPAPGAAISARR